MFYEPFFRHDSHQERLARGREGDRPIAHDGFLLSLAMFWTDSPVGMFLPIF